MFFVDLALNLAAGLAQWLFEPQLGGWRRRISDPQHVTIHPPPCNKREGMFGPIFEFAGPVRS